MDLKQSKSFNFLKRSVAIGFVVAGLFCFCLSSFSIAQQRAGRAAVDRYEHIDEAEGMKRMVSFRNQRLAGDYCFRFELEHLPRRGKKVTHYGVMWGSWNEQGPVTRIHILTGDVAAENEESLELIIQNGLEPKVWARTSSDEAFVILEGGMLFEPVIPSVVYAPFDLQMPFVYWDTFIYEGPARVGSRVAQQFLMMPPEGSASIARGIESVRISLDDAYDSLWRVEVLGQEEESLSRFTVESIKRVQGQYIIKEIALKDYASKERTRFKVKSASVGLVLDKKIFSALHSVLPEVLPDSLFEEL